jgi:predicted DNA-binding transcriptional regulator AlpA
LRASTDPPTLDDLPDLLSARHVTRLCGVSMATLKSWTRRGLFPSPLILGGTTWRWRKCSVLAYLAEAEAAGKAVASA